MHNKGSAYFKLSQFKLSNPEDFRFGRLFTISNTSLIVTFMHPYMRTYIIKTFQNINHIIIIISLTKYSRYQQMCDSDTDIGIFNKNVQKYIYKFYQ